MTDLTDFVNVMASAEDWLAAGASDRETAAPPGEPMCRSVFIAGSRPLAPAAG
jgi:hypothetical protein